MSAPEVRVHDDAGALVGDVASRLLEELERVQADGSVPQICLTGGTIAVALHREVARRAPDSSVDWSRVVVWFGDERFAEAASPDRNAGQAREALLDSLPLDPTHVHEMPASDAGMDLDQAAAAYADELRAHGGSAFDVMMLGMGPDGHIASLFPGHPALDAEGVAVAVRESPKPPPERVSLTFGALNRSRQVWFLVNGEGKAEAVARALAEDGSVAQTPARGVRGQESTVWWIDRAAAAQLPG